MMRRISLSFLFIAILAFAAADIEITTLDPIDELTRLAMGFAQPNLSSLSSIWVPLGNTISFALIGIAGALILGAVLSLYFEKRCVRLFCAFIRSIHELFWAFLIMPITGLNSLCGILAIMIPYAGIFAKVYAEIREEADLRPKEALSNDVSRVSAFFYTVLPIIYVDIKSYTAYRFECALRSSAILGFIGLPTIGYHLETAFSEGLYAEAAALLYLFYLLILSIPYWLKTKFLPLILPLGIYFCSWDFSFSMTNLLRFVTYDILPWPIRAEGFYRGSGELVFNATEIGQWASEILLSMVMPGVWSTIILTQIALVASAMFTLLAFPFASHVFFAKKARRVANLLLVVLRTTPEYIFAYIFLQLWGPSMLPAIFALFMHNGAILAHLMAQHIGRIDIVVDTTAKRINRYFFEVLPRTYGQFLAYLFYRWEVIMRESAILGILGITTLGFYIDSAITRDHLDTAIFLIMITALLNMAIDTCSQVIRRRLKINNNIVSN